MWELDGGSEPLTAAVGGGARAQLLRTLGMSVFGALAWDRVCTMLFARRLVLVGVCA